MFSWLCWEPGQSDLLPESLLSPHSLPQGLWGAEGAVTQKAHVWLSSAECLTQQGARGVGADVGVKVQGLRLQGHDSWVARGPLSLTSLRLGACLSTLKSR